MAAKTCCATFRADSAAAIRQASTKIEAFEGF
jgi:hypothetical protein